MLKRLLLLLLLLSTLLPAAEFKVEGNAFVLEGQPFQIRSGEMHYSRVNGVGSRGLTCWDSPSRRLYQPPHKFRHLSSRSALTLDSHRKEAPHPCLRHHMRSSPRICLRPPKNLAAIRQGLRLGSVFRCSPHLRTSTCIFLPYPRTCNSADRTVEGQRQAIRPLPLRSIARMAGVTGVSDIYGSDVAPVILSNL